MSTDFENLAGLMRARPGLIIGPDATLDQHQNTDPVQQLLQSLGLDMAIDFVDAAIRARRGGAQDDAVRSRAREAWSAQRAHSSVRALVGVRWSAILSLTPDRFLEDQLERLAAQKPLAQVIILDDDLRAALPPRALPVYKLLGSIGHDTVPISEAEYTRRRARWKHAIAAFSERVRRNAVVCIGMRSIQSAFADLLAELAADPRHEPSLLIIPKADLSGFNPTVTELLAQFKVFPTDQDAKEIVAAVQHGGQLPLVEITLGKDPLSQLSRWSEVCTVVNARLTSSVSADERTRLLELAFSPDTNQWDSFVHGLDLRRSLEHEVLAAYTTAVARGMNDAAIVLHGNAATGKTTLLRRVAFELARRPGCLVLWMRPSPHQDRTTLAGELLRTAAKLKTSHPQTVIFIDDPFGFGMIGPREIASAARAAGLNALLCLGVRQSDRQTRPRDEIAGGLGLAAMVEMPDVLDDAELRGLPDYLASLGIVRNAADASPLVKRVADQQSADTLSALYYLLPQTQEVIRGSVNDEFFRLGSAAAIARIVIGEAEHSTRLLRDAYEMVAVAESIGVPVPIEVLVSALQVSYREWMSAVDQRGPAWGLLYPDEWPEVDTSVYRTRNAIVARIIVETVNSGSLSHAGEFRVLQKLIAACNGTSPVYREFAVSVLVRRRAAIEDRFSADEGRVLFQTAAASLPLPDKTLSHHYGLWLKNVARDPSAAIVQLQAALQTPQYPYASRAEADEHIYTSVAAATVDAIDAGAKDLVEGQKEVLGLLSRARSETFFNANAVHVQARLMLRLIAKHAGAVSADAAQLLVSALANIDLTLLTLSARRKAGERESEDVSMLEAARVDLERLAGTDDDLDATAERLWDSVQDQAGFVLAARRRLHQAMTSGKGREYKAARQYCEDVINRVVTTAPVAATLYEVLVEIIYEWRVRRVIGASGEAGQIDWGSILDYSNKALGIGGVVATDFLKYIQALALSHLTRWNDAEAVFRDLRARLPREIVHAPRDVLIGEGGGLRSVQGVMRSTSRGGRLKRLLYVKDVGHDFIAAQLDSWPKDGEFARAFVIFSFAGPMAMLELPSDWRSTRSQST